MYLELGLMPIRFIIVLRILSFLRHILKQQHKNSLLFQFFKAQLENPKLNDWITRVMKDLEKVNIDLELIEIQNMTEESLKKLCKEKVILKAFEYLILKHTKRNPHSNIK